MPNITFQVVVRLDVETVALLGRLVVAVEALAADARAAPAPAAPVDAPVIAEPAVAPVLEPAPQRGGARFGHTRREPPAPAEIDDAPLPVPLPTSHGQPPPAALRSRDGFPSVGQREDAAAAVDAVRAPASYETVAAWGDANGVPVAGGTDARLARLKRINARRGALGLPRFIVPVGDLLRGEP